jgi:hypothetical protein
VDEPSWFVVFLVLVVLPIAVLWAAASLGGLPGFVLALAGIVLFILSRSPVLDGAHHLHARGFPALPY